MSDYLRTISKISNSTNNKNVKILNSILNYYYYFNDLGEKINTQMKMKSDTKNLNLLGNFKIKYDKDSLYLNKVIFTSPKKTIIIFGSFKKIDDAIIYHRHNNIYVEILNDLNLF